MSAEAMRPKVAAESREADPFPTISTLVAFAGRYRRNERLHKRFAPAGTMHLYFGGATTTACGLALHTLTLFPTIDWPGGVALSNPRCGACGERLTG